jgi:hypothetical protein
METRQIEVKSWNRFLTRNLAVKPEVLGCEHRFSFDDRIVSIKVPSSIQVDRERGYNKSTSVASIANRRAVDDEPLEYYIHSVDVEVSIPDTLTIPSEVLNLPPNAPEVSQLMKFVEQHKPIAEKAFEYWIRIVRWVCDDSRIGQNKVENYRSGWSTKLIDVESDTTVFGTQKFYALGYKTLSVEEWEKIRSELSSSSQPPVYVELKHDAEENIRLGDYGLSLLYLAFACEVFLRFAVIGTLPKTLNDEVIRYIERANVSLYIDKLFPEILDVATKKQFKSIKSDLHSLSEHRNKVVHMGNDEGVDEKLCLRFLKVTEELLSIAYLGL